VAEDEDDVIGVCTECHSEQPMKYMETSPFTQAGQSAPCKMCGGVTMIVSREDRETALKQSDRERGL
jgi:hypothetical protein